MATRQALLRDRVKGLNEHIGTVRDDYGGIKNYEVKAKLPGDSDVTGFARGVDDLGQILLNAKKEVKFNRNLVTPAGAEYWVYKKNQKLPANKPKWKYAYTDINGDKVPEVIIMDGQNNIRYINGYHLAKSKHNYNYAYQEFVDSFGTPFERQLKRAKLEIQPERMSQKTFKWENTTVDPQNPDGALIAIDLLAKHGYKPKAPSACNLLLSYFTKFAYQKKAAALFTKDSPTYKAMNKIFGVIRMNAELYGEYVTEYINQEILQMGISDKDAKKRNGKAASIYSRLSLERVKQLCDSESLKAEMESKIEARLKEIYNAYLNGYTIPEKQKYRAVNPRQYQEGTSPNIQQYLNSYGMTNTLTDEQLQQALNRRSGGATLTKTITPPKVNLNQLRKQAAKARQTDAYKAMTGQNSNNDEVFSQPEVND